MDYKLSTGGSLQMNFDEIANRLAVEDFETFNNYSINRAIPLSPGDCASEALKQVQCATPAERETLAGYIQQSRGEVYGGGVNCDGPPSISPGCTILLSEIKRLNAPVSGKSGMSRIAAIFGVSKKKNCYVRRHSEVGAPQPSSQSPAPGRAAGR
ncbi:hypothetical protein [Streptomyces globisporus]|uniref:hypothetical protein n=1 Tax=Streptomyces globisporus TaxID=1908 RepID=UPI00386D447F